MTEAEVAAAERDVTLVCTRGHHKRITTVAGIRDAEFDDECRQSRCSQCGAYWMYATDGQKVRPMCDVVSPSSDNSGDSDR